MQPGTGIGLLVVVAVHEKCGRHHRAEREAGRQRRRHADAAIDVKVDEGKAQDDGQPDGDHGDEGAHG